METRAGNCQYARMSKFFGQQLSDRSFAGRSPDPLGRRIWVALRYITVIASVLVVAKLFDRSPGGAALTGLGAGAFVSGLLNVVFLPRDERSLTTDRILLIGGAAASAIGTYLLATSS